MVAMVNELVTRLVLFATRSNGLVAIEIARLLLSRIVSHVRRL